MLESEQIVIKPSQSQQQVIYYERGPSAEFNFAIDPAYGARNQMDTVTAADKSYPLNERGFLADPGVWDLDFAAAMASRLGMPGELKLLQLKAVLFVRHFYVRRGRVPRIFETCRGCGLSLTTLRTLFPCGYQRAVCRLSGISYDAIDRNHHALTFETRFRQNERREGSSPGRTGSHPGQRRRG